MSYSLGCNESCADLATTANNLFASPHEKITVFYFIGIPVRFNMRPKYAGGTSTENFFEVSN